MLGHHRRRWANINTTTGRHVNWGSVSHIKEIQLKLIGHLVQLLVDRPTSTDTICLDVLNIFYDSVAYTNNIYISPR